MKINVTVSGQVQEKLSRMQGDIEAALDRAIIQQSAEIQAESHLIQLGFVKLSARAIVMAAWLKRAQQREEANQGQVKHERE